MVIPAPPVVAADGDYIVGAREVVVLCLDASPAPAGLVRRIPALTSSP